MNAIQLEFMENVCQDPVMRQLCGGFPATSTEQLESDLDLNAELAPRPSSTFYARVDSNSMQDLNIDKGDLLVIDRSIRPVNGSVTVCYVEGQFTLKTITINNGSVYLIPANKDLKPVKVFEGENFIVWGVVTYVIKKMG